MYHFFDARTIFLLPVAFFLLLVAFFLLPVAFFATSIIFSDVYFLLERYLSFGGEHDVPLIDD